MIYIRKRGFPGGVRGKEPTCQCRRDKRCRFDPWIRKIAWRRTWQPTSVFLPEESPWTEQPGGLQSIGSLNQLSMDTHMHMRKQLFKQL